MTIPLQNAKDTLLNANPGTLPNLQGAILDWFQPMTFTRIVKTTVGFKLKEVETPVTFQGVRQPFTAQQLNMRPEGQRSWKWETLHAFPQLALDPDEVVVFNGVRYRVMQKLDWTEYGYIEYHIVQDYTP